MVYKKDIVTCNLCLKQHNKTEPCKNVDLRFRIFNMRDEIRNLHLRIKDLDIDIAFYIKIIRGK